ncbi:MAG: hypothetical protein IJU91_08620 [Selenomonadaceae bacterium]|nr:hypothetical protein [Selenomonadaceae bacterium]
MTKFFQVLALIFIFTNCAVGFAESAEVAESEEEELTEEEQAQRGIKIASERLKKDFPFTVEARIFLPSMDGHVKSHGVKIGDDAFNLNQMGLDSNVAPEFIFRYKNISVDYLRLKESGGFYGRDNALTFGGKNFSGNVTAESDLHYIKLNVDREIFSLMETRAAWNYGVTGIKWRGSVENFSGRQDENYFFPMPTIGIALEMAVRPKIKIYTNISGMVLGGHGHLCDFEGGFRYMADKNFSCNVGFRHIDAKINWRSVHGDFKLNGFYAGLRADF